MAVITGTSGADSLSGTAGPDDVSGLAGGDTLLGGGGSDTLLGGKGRDALLGGAGADALNGGIGIDTLRGGAGNDSYTIDAADALADSGGIDTVRANFSYTLLSGFEKLVLLGGAAINGTGNGAANTITGNTAANRVSGGGGNDTLTGAGGKDTLIGGAGADSLVGGGGNDTYTIDASDALMDSGGIDTVRANFSYTLLSGFEKLVLLGSSVINGTGNGVANTITGNTAGNVLNGGGGNDTLTGGGGNDTLIGGAGVDSFVGGGGNDSYTIDASDVLVESTGIDTVQANFSYTLLGGFETLILTGNAAISGTGNSAANTITGNNAANLLSGGGGNDTLNGLGGNDTLKGIGGNDVLIHGAGDASVHGGLGMDTLQVNGGGVTLDLTAIADAVHQDLEVIDLTGGGANTLIVAALDVTAISSSTDTLRVDGNAGDRVIAADGNWAYVQNVVIGAQTYGEYTNGSATLQVDVDIDRDAIAQSSINLSILDGTNGFRLAGVAGSDHSGFSVSAAGDVNGDGFDDLIVGADSADPNGSYSGASYVVFGKAAGLASSIDLSSLDGMDGFRLAGTAGGRSGRSVSAAGDVNGDGFADLIVGAPHASPNGSGSGASYVVFGQASGFASSMNLSSLDGTSGFRLAGVAADDRSGCSVSTAGDVNGDGFGDVIVGAYDITGSSPGASYVVFGKAAGFASSINLSTLNGTNGFRLAGVAAGDYVGVSVSAAGDVNGDGFADLIVGAPHASPNGSGSGASYVVFGQASGFASSMNLSSLDGTSGFRLAGVAADDRSGCSVSTAGDVNGDGFGDLIVGAFIADPNGNFSGASYVVFGKAAGFASSINLSTLDGANGFRLAGAAAGDHSGVSVSAAGDVNGDGFDDLIVGALRADATGSSSGASYVVFGQATGFASSIDLSSLDGTNGFRLAGVAAGDLSGYSVSAAGDVNGDGFDDLIVGALAADPNGGGSGASYVIFGGDFTGAVTFLGTSGADALTGSVAAETFVSGLGNDTVTGGGGADVIRGGAGNDLIRVANLAFADIDGGSGADTLAILGGGRTLNLLNRPNNELTGIERIDLTGSGDNTLGLAASDLLNLSDSMNQLIVDGNAGDAVVTDDAGWLIRQHVVLGSQTYAEYTNGAARLLVDADIDRSGIDTTISIIELSGLNGISGFRLDGVAANDRSGRSVSAAGDVNGDGFGDVIVGAYNASPNGDASGASYVVFGKAAGFAASINLSTLDGTNGFRLAGVAEDDRSGCSVSVAGDVNGDGYGDFIIGAFGADAHGAYSGASYVVFGSASDFAASINLSSLDGGNGFRLAGAAANDWTGISVSAAGDVNGDGLDDLIVGAARADPNGSYSGASYVVFGQGTGFASSINLSSLDGTNGFRLAGTAAGDNSGASVSAAGDVNGDGFDDLIVGAYAADPNGDLSGASYVVFGKASGFASTISLGTLDGTDGFRLAGAATGDWFGRSVSAAGDVDGDGFDDLIVGAYRADPNGEASGASYVVFGKASGFASTISLATLDGSNGFRLDGVSTGDRSGRSVAAAGDVNGDGFDDLIVGAFFADPNGNYSGASYVVFGKASGFASSTDLSTLDGTNGFRLDGAAAADRSGFSVDAAGDVNGDGFDDLIVGAYDAPNGAQSGASYVVFGGDFAGAVAHLGTSGADELTGGVAAETFVSGLGKDTVTGGGGADVIRTGAGNDLIEVANLGFADIDSGSGSADMLAILGSGRTLNLGARPNNEITGIERIDLTGSGGNTLRLSHRDLFDLSDTTNQLRVDGNAGDTVDLVGTWTDGSAGATYHTYTLGAATILIDNDIFVT